MSAGQTCLPLAAAPRSGEVLLVEVGGHQVGLYRVGEAFHALADRCPHRGAPLVSSGRVVRGVTLTDEGPTRGRERALVRCPWHKWDFEIATGRCLVHPRVRVRRYDVAVEDETITISLRHPRSRDDRP